MAHRPASAAPSHSSRERGFTLLELLVVIGVVVALGMAVIPSIEAVMGVKTREEVGKLAGSIRAMYGEAALSGRTCRLVFDLDETLWWPECGAGRVRVSQREESSRGARVEEKAKDKWTTEEEKEAMAEVEAKRAFAPYESGSLAPNRRLPEGTTFESVWTQHQTEPYTKGKAYLYFFPQGQTERAYLHVGDGRDTYTIIVNPMTGRTKVVGEKVPVPDREMRK
ncbi:pilus assembly FimT family protein [Vulgatibacter incomptus]|uniref:General secretion pathway protein H n=1 Tax=Vulgatibacter incomptus TaxID=1391653 RepID=A0A0K1PCS6_9BACT|nr:type II secretion system protein [Vulgatibacter incomptus]AKU91325.1 General secretion pathway protein H [Vulgatibacter incomptus]